MNSFVDNGAVYDNCAISINNHAAIPSKILNIGSIGPIKEFHILHCFVIGKSTKVGL